MNTVEHPSKTCSGCVQAPGAVTWVCRTAARFPAAWVGHPALRFSHVIADRSRGAC